MDYDAIFEDYYTQYRAEATVPTSTDDEYKIGMRYANTAVRRWANYDNTYWKELFNTLQKADDGTKVVTTGTLTYDAPSDMKEAGGFIKILDSTGNTIRRYQILEPQDAQFRGDNSTYAFFTGDVSNGFTLHLNPAPDSAISGMSIDYVYYKQPTLFTKGADSTEMSDPEMVVDRMLYMRFKASRNPYYADALRDAEDKLKIMQMTNNSGNWADPWKLQDHSGSIFGA